MRKHVNTGLSWGQTHKKPASPASNGQNEKGSTSPQSAAASNGTASKKKGKSANKKGHETVSQPINKILSESDVSYDGQPQSLDEMRRYFENKFKLQEAENVARYETLSKLLDKKDAAIAQLNQKVGELTGELNYLKDSLSFMSNETTVIKDKLESTKVAHEKK